MKNERRKYMNSSKQDILNNLIKEPFINQRILAAQTGHSLGIVNRSIKELISEGYLDEEIRSWRRKGRRAAFLPWTDSLQSSRRPSVPGISGFLLLHFLQTELPRSHLLLLLTG